MDAIKKHRILLIFLLIIFIPLAMLSQKSKFPKDTIYVKYENKTGPKKWNAKFKRDYHGKPGIYFNVENKDGDMALFYAYKQKVDTLCILHLKDYKMLNLKEIREKEINWVDRKFKNQKYKPYSGGSKNSVFHTYLIEVISEEKFVIYPVIWRNEGVID